MGKIVNVLIIITFVVMLYTIYQNSIGAFDERITTPDRQNYKIPEWVKANAGWWSEGLISDTEFSYSLQWLFDHGYVTIEKCVGECIEN